MTGLEVAGDFFEDDVPDYDAEEDGEITPISIRKRRAGGRKKENDKHSKHAAEVVGEKRTICQVQK
jgi:hypothetical protein